MFPLFVPPHARNGDPSSARKPVPFEYRTYASDWDRTYDQKTKLLLPRPDVYRYVFWEKEYVCKWFVSSFKRNLPDTIRIARYRAYPVGPGRAKSSKEESLEWVKRNLPYICLLHCYTGFEIAAETYLKFKDEFDVGEDLMQRRHLKAQTDTQIRASKAREALEKDKNAEEIDDTDEFAYFGV